MTYSLKALAPKRKGTVSLPVIEERAGAIAEYHRGLRAMLRGLRDETKASVLPRLKADRGLTTDAAEREWFLRLRAAQRLLQGVAERMVERVLRQEAERHTAAWTEGVRRSLGVDVAAVLTNEGLEAALGARVLENVRLISSIGEEAVSRVERIVINATVNGTNLKTVRKELTEAFAMSDRRAGIVARDQLAKVNSDMNRLRQQEAGVTEYRWSASGDERTRPLHARIDGRTYTWGKPTDAEDGLPPGQPPLCRCVALGIVTFD